MDSIKVPHLKAGVYRHYKGKKYQVIGVGIDSETEQPVVIYKPLYECEVQLWVRPYEMFTGTVEVNGISAPRFRAL